MGFKRALNSRVAAVGVGGAVLALLASGAGYAAGQIDSGDIQNNSIRSKDIRDNTIRGKDVKDGALRLRDLSDGTRMHLQGNDGLPGADGADGADGAEGPQGPEGPKGDPGNDGKDAMFGAVYRIANYTAGGGGRATVACADTDAESQAFTAIAGGARVEVPGSGTNTEDITSSFPGRMDWGTNLPKPGRLDGWVVYFGDGAAPNSDAGNVLEVWALCVPTTGIPTEVTNY